MSWLDSKDNTRYFIELNKEVVSDETNEDTHKINYRRLKKNWQTKCKNNKDLKFDEGWSGTGFTVENKKTKKTVAHVYCYTGVRFLNL